jgi:hypothetical protein
MQFLYKGQVGSRLYGCESSTSDNDYFILVPDNDLITEGSSKILTPTEDSFLHPINAFANRIFSTTDKAITYYCHNANLPE